MPTSVFITENVKNKCYPMSRMNNTLRLPGFVVYQEKVCIFSYPNAGFNVKCAVQYLVLVLSIFNINLVILSSS